MSDDWNIIDFWAKQCFDDQGVFDYRKFGEGLVYDILKLMHFDLCASERLNSKEWDRAERIRNHILKIYNLELIPVSM